MKIFTFGGLKREGGGEWTQIQKFENKNPIQNGDTIAHQKCQHLPQLENILKSGKQKCEENYIIRKKEEILY